MKIAGQIQKAVAERLQTGKTEGLQFVTFWPGSHLKSERWVKATLEIPESGEERDKMRRSGE